MLFLVHVQQQLIVRWECFCSRGHAQAVLDCVRGALSGKRRVSGSSCSSVVTVAAAASFCGSNAAVQRAMEQTHMRVVT